MIENISLDYLKIFYEVARQGNVTKASNALLISQPAVTQTINKLETAFSAKLFIRQHRGMKLTEIGEKVFEQVGFALGQLNNINSILQEDTKLIKGTINIGSGSLLAKEILVNPMKGFTKMYPGIKFKIEDEPSNILMEKLALGELDLVLGKERDYLLDKYNFTSVVDVNYVFVCGSKHKAKNITTLKQLENESIITLSPRANSRRDLENFIRTKKIKLDIAIQATGYNTALSLAKENLGVAFVPDYLINDLLKAGQVVKLPVDLKLPKRSYGYYTNKNFVNKATSEFIKYI